MRSSGAEPPINQGDGPRPHTMGSWDRSLQEWAGGHLDLGQTNGIGKRSYSTTWC